MTPGREPLLVTIEIRFVTSEDPRALADRVRESISTIVGRDALEEFRARSMPLSPPKGSGNERGGDLPSA